MPEMPKVVAYIAPSIHPAILTPEATALGPDSAVLASCQATLTAAYQTCDAISAASKAAFAEHDIRNAISIQNARRTGKYPEGSYHDGAKIVHPLDAPAAVALNDAVANAWENSVKPKLAASMTLVETRVAALERGLNEIVTDPAASTPAGLHYVDKIHALIKALPASERSNWVMTKIGELNLRAVSAIVNSEPEFSGIDPKMIAILRTKAQEKFNPPMVLEMAHVRSLQTKLKRAAELAAGHVVKNTVPVRKSKSVDSLNALRAIGKVA